MKPKRVAKKSIPHKSNRNKKPNHEKDEQKGKCDIWQQSRQMGVYWKSGAITDAETISYQFHKKTLIKSKHILFFFSSEKW